MADGLFGLGQPDPTKLTADQLTQIAIAEAMNKAGAGGNSVPAPASQEWLLMKAPEGTPAQAGLPSGWTWVKNQAYQPKAATAPTAFGSKDIGYWIVDPTDPTGVKNLVPAGLPNADEEMTKAIDRQTREAERNEKERNLALSGSYATDDELSKRNVAARQVGVNEGQLKADWAKQDEAKRQFDIKQKNDDAKAASDLLVAAQQVQQSKAQTGLIGAQTTQAGATTSEIQQKIEQAAAKFPIDLAQAQATHAGTLASTAQQLQATKIAGAPQVQTPQAGMYQWQRDPITGAVTQAGINPEYQAKTAAEVEARVGQIQTLAQQKKQELLAKSAADPQGYTAERAVADFHAWYDQNVTPQMGALQAAQDTAAAERTRLDMAARGTAYQQALGAGTQMTQALKEDRQGRAGPGFGALLQQIGSNAGSFAGADLSKAFGFQAPNIADRSQQAVMEALKHISPTAAQATGSPMPSYGAVNIQEALNPTQYQFGAGGGAPPAGPPAAAPFTPRPGETAAQSIDRHSAALAAMAPVTTPSVAPSLLPSAAAPTAMPLSGDNSAGGLAPVASSYMQAAPRPAYVPPIAGPAPVYSDAAAKLGAGLGAGGLGPDYQELLRQALASQYQFNPYANQLTP